jgi:hypothetical protein
MGVREVTEREMAAWFSGRWDRFGGYIRVWFDGPGIGWRTGLSRMERPSLRWLKANPK